MKHYNLNLQFVIVMARPTKRSKLPDIPSVINESDICDNNLWIPHISKWFQSIREMSTGVPIANAAELPGDYMVELILRMVSKSLGGSQPLQLYENLCSGGPLVSEKNPGSPSWLFCQFVHGALKASTSKSKVKKDIHNLYKGTMDMFFQGPPINGNQRQIKCYLYSSFIAGLTLKLFSLSNGFQNKAKNLSPSQHLQLLSDLLPNVTEKYRAFRNSTFCVGVTAWENFDGCKLKLRSAHRGFFVDECFDHSQLDVIENVTLASKSFEPINMYIPVPYEKTSDICQDLSEQEESELRQLKVTDTKIEGYKSNKAQLALLTKACDDDLARAVEKRNMQALSLKMTNCNKTLMYSFWDFFRRYSHADAGPLDPLGFMSKLQEAALGGFLHGVAPIEMTDDQFWNKFSNDGPAMSCTNFSSQQVTALNAVRVGEGLNLDAVPSAETETAEVDLDEGGLDPIIISNKYKSCIPSSVGEEDTLSPHLIVRAVENGNYPDGPRSRTNVHYKVPAPNKDDNSQNWTSDKIMGAEAAADLHVGFDELQPDLNTPPGPLAEFDNSRGLFEPNIGESCSLADVSGHSSGFHSGDQSFDSLVANE